MAKTSLQDIARQAGVSVKTVSGALHGGSPKMATTTRTRIQAIASELGYVPNLAARGMRQGHLPLVGLAADGLITQPFATDIVRSFDAALAASGLAVVATAIGGAHTAESVIADFERFIPRAVAYAAMYHKRVELPASARHTVRLMINCRDASGEIGSLVPAEADAAATIVAHLFARGRRAVAFLNLPGLLAGELREAGFRRAHAEADRPVQEAWIRPATRGGTYSDRAGSLVGEHIASMMSGSPRPDAILCGNDRVAMEAYNALRRAGITIPGEVAVASFDNQVEIASRLDPPLTTMALPHRRMGRRAAEILLASLDGDPVPAGVEEVPFRLVDRHSV